MQRTQPDTIRLTTSDLENLETLLRYYIRYLNRRDPSDTGKEIRALQNLKSRVNGTRMRATSGRKQMQNMIRGRRTSNETHLVNLQTKDEQTALKDAAEWGVKNTEQRHLARDILKQLGKQR